MEPDAVMSDGAPGGGVGRCGGVRLGGARRAGPVQAALPAPVRRRPPAARADGRAAQGVQSSLTIVLGTAGLVENSNMWWRPACGWFGLSPENYAVVLFIMYSCHKAHEDVPRVSTSYCLPCQSNRVSLGAWRHAGQHILKQGFKNNYLWQGCIERHIAVQQSC